MVKLKYVFKFYDEMPRALGYEKINDYSIITLTTSDRLNLPIFYKHNFFYLNPKY